MGVSVATELSVSTNSGARNSHVVAMLMPKPTVAKRIVKVRGKPALPTPSVVREQLVTLVESAPAVAAVKKKMPPLVAKTVAPGLKQLKTKTLVVAANLPIISTAFPHLELVVGVIPMVVITKSQPLAAIPAVAPPPAVFIFKTQPFKTSLAHTANVAVVLHRHQPATITGASIRRLDSSITVTTPFKQRLILVTPVLAVMQVSSGIRVRP